jgi:translation initiation factor IF-2
LILTKKAAAVAAPVNSTPEVPPIVAAKVEALKAKTSTEKPVVKEKVQEKRIRKR